MLPVFRIFDEEKEEKHQVIERMTGITSHNGCIRLFPEDFWLVLPKIFVTDKDMGKVYRNNEFAKDLKVREKIKRTFCDVGKCPDAYFNYFYKYLSVYGQQKKEWIDKPTKVKYVN